MYRDYKSQLKVPYNIGDRILNRYEVVRVMWGGMGYVFVCKDLESKIIVALKTFNPKTFDVEGFRKEARNWISIGEHLNIVEAFDVFVIDSIPFVVMEYISGSNMGASLREWLINSHHLDLKHILQFAYQICNGIEYAWLKINLVHQDIKPENLLISHDEIVKVSDFGLSKSIFCRIGLGGTYYYMSPEHFCGNTDTRSDIYSTGITIYEMIEGKPPFLGPTPEDFRRQHESREPVFSRTTEADTLRKLQNIVRKAIEKSPEKRYKNFSETMEDLDYLYHQEYGRSLKEQYKTHRSPSYRLSDQGFALYTLGFEKEGIDLLQDAIAKDPTNLPALYVVTDYMGYKEGTEKKEFWRRILQQLIKDLKVPWKTILFILLVVGTFLATAAGFKIPIVSFLYFNFMLFLLIESYINFYSGLSLNRITLFGIGLGLSTNLILSFIYKNHTTFDIPLMSLGKSISGIVLSFLLGFVLGKGIGRGTKKLMIAIGALVGGGFLYVFFLWSCCSLIWSFTFYLIHKFRRIILKKKKVFVSNHGEGKFVKVMGGKLPASLGFFGALVLYILFRDQIHNYFAPTSNSSLFPHFYVEIWEFMKSTFYRY